MDTKLKKFNDYLSVRACAFILCIALLMLSATTIYIGVKKVVQAQNNNFGIYITDLSESDSYFETDSFSQWVESAMSNMKTLVTYGSREDITAGKYITDSELDMVLEESYQEMFAYAEDSILNGEEVTDDNRAYVNQYGDDPSHPDYSAELKSYSEVKEQFIKDYPEIVDSARASIISFQLGTFDEAKSYLDRIEGVGYSVTLNKTTISENMVNEEEGVVITIKDGSVTTSSNNYYIDVNKDEILANYFYESMQADENRNIVFSLSIDNGLSEELITDFASAKQIYNQFSIIAVTALIGALLLFIYLCIVTGRRDSDGNVILYRADRLYTEIQLLIILGLSAGAIVPVLMLNITLGDLSMYNWITDTYNIAFLILGIALVTIIMSGILWFTLAIVRMIKAGIFLKRSLIVMALKAVYRWISTAFSSVNPMGKYVIIIIAACIISMVNILAPVVILLMLGFGYTWIKKYTAVKKGVEEVTNGNLEYKIPVDEGSNNEFDHLAKQINTISQASNIAIQNELKNQRLKTDLISNVSHDLKTPLTSIITYTDLLKKEGLDSPDAERYLGVIDEKGQRLKALTEDLFEAAKASSGSVPVRMEKVDLLALIRQGLVEKGDGIERRGLNIIINAEKDNYYVNADSQLLWRVVENLFNNVEKYALENSRVYIDLNELKSENYKKPVILFEMKNMSKAPLNIAEDELMERFKRGDESRTSDGSGLGLAIAKDLMKLQKGWFEIKIDGDLFKSSVILDIYDEDIVKAAEKAAREETVIEEKMMKNDDMPKIK